MKTKRTAPPRRRISFAVDRDEIEINSNWVEAVMAAPTAAPAQAGPFPPPLPVQEQSVRSEGSEQPPFFVAETENATEAQSTTGVTFTSVANTTPADGASLDPWTVEIKASVERLAPVEEFAIVERVEPGDDGVVSASLTTTGELSTTVETLTTVVKTVRQSIDATVVEPSSVATIAAVTPFQSGKGRRTPKRRPLVRVTDGLTPGQYSVYSLMYEAGETASEAARIYKGGYADLCRLTGLSKRGIQNIVADLQEKQVIRLHQHPGYHRTQTSAYLVPETAEVLKSWNSRGWHYALGKSKLLVS